MDIPLVKEEILSRLPVKFKNIIQNVDFEKVQEIRFRSGRPLMIEKDDKTIMLTAKGEETSALNRALLIEQEDISSLLSSFCENSVYAYQNEICDGFLTIKGGHRVGLCGKCVMADGKIVNITEICGLNLRIAKQYIGCAETLTRKLLKDEKRVANTIFLAPPQCGKTTYLRDLARALSKNNKVTIVDTRSEIAAVKDGVPQFDVGLQTDVLDRFPKAQGMLFALRGMSPDVIITDELGGEEDIRAVKSVLNAGISIVTSMHGKCPEELLGERAKLFSLFDFAVILSRTSGIPEVGSIIKIENVGEIKCLP